MSVKEACEVVKDSVLDTTVDTVVQELINQEEEVVNIDKRKEFLDTEIQNLKTFIQKLEEEKSNIDDQITILKLRNVAYQKEHTNLRNAITVVKFQIEKIKESIEKAKVKELKDLEEFEKSVDQITAKFRSGLEIYDRKTLQEKIEKEKEKKAEILRKTDELMNSYLEFNEERGLRVRKNEKEDLMDCVLPGSKLFCLIEMTKNLDEAIRHIKNVIREAKELGKSGVKSTETFNQTMQTKDA